MARIVLVTTGGTIASRTDPATGAAVACLGAGDLIAAVPELADVADVEVVEFASVNSWDVTPQMIADLARRVRGVTEEVRPDGIVVTHGTDTMEETAFALEILLDIHVPVVLTGAMRPADALGPDGPRNLLSAARVATSDAARELGAVVVMNDEIHAARYVTKSHTTALDTFASPGVGALGTVDAAGIVVRWWPDPLPTVPAVDPEPAVELVTMVTGLGEAPLRRVAGAGARGVVIEGSGSGNIHSEAQPALSALLEADVPVVLASRCGAGRVVAAYGGRGGGATLAEIGAVPAGDISGPKARLALMFLLGGGADTEAVRRWFERVT